MAHWPEMTALSDQLVELQRIDTLADQLIAQRERTPLRTALGEATTQMRAWAQRRAEMEARIEALATEVEQDEERGRQLADHLARLERQLKTVIAPREAEALMHEITTLTTQRDELDIREIEAMEEEGELETSLIAHLDAERALRDAAAVADDELSVAVADIDTQLVTLADERISAVAALPDTLISRYDRARPQLGIVVSQLVGTQCTGCHLDLAAAEIDTARVDAADTGFTDCPQCGRILVISERQTGLDT
jgi:uncharacterized protein